MLELTVSEVLYIHICEVFQRVFPWRTDASFLFCRMKAFFNGAMALALAFPNANAFVNQLSICQTV